MFSTKLIRLTLAHNVRRYSLSGGGKLGKFSKIVENIREGIDKRSGVEGAIGKIKNTTPRRDPRLHGHREKQASEAPKSSKITSSNDTFGSDSTSDVRSDLQKTTDQLNGSSVNHSEINRLPVTSVKQSEDITIIEDFKKKYNKDHPEYEDLGPDEDRHTEWKENERKKLNKKAMVPFNFFQNVKDKNKETFVMALNIFTERDIRLRGHVEFIYAALKEMKTFGVHRDLEAYKKLIDVFPKGKMIASNRLEVEFMHFPKQQQCALDLLEQMEEYAVMPDSEVHSMLTNIFGSLSFPMRKVMRMQYWMPKFKNLSPWPVPFPTPDDALELAKLAIQRMTSVDLQTKITIYDAGDLEDAVDHTWIVSGQSADQQSLIEKHPSDRPIYVEGAFRIWLRDTCINYFILRAEPVPRPEKVVDSDDVSELEVLFEEDYIEKAVASVPTVHEQEDGSILAVCATGSSSRDSVVSWIRFLEESNPRLGEDVSVLFTFRSPIGTTDDLEVLSEAETLKQMSISQGQGTLGAGLGLNPSKPDLRNVGIWSQSESRFVNWPHHPEHSASKLLLQMRDRKKAISDGTNSESSNDLKEKDHFSNKDCSDSLKT